MIAASFLLNPDLSDTWELNFSSLETNYPSESKTVPHTLPLELRKSNPLSLLPPTIEVLEGSLEVSQGFLGCTLGNLIHPWELGPLQTVQKLMLLHGVSESVLALVGLEEVDSMLKTPIIGKTSDSSMSVKRRPLAVVWVELIPVGFMDQHAIQDIVLVV